MTLQEIMNFIRESDITETAIYTTAVVGTMWLSFVITKRVLTRVITSISKRSKTRFDDLLLEEGVFQRAAWLAPGIVAFQATQFFPRMTEFLDRVVYSFLTIVVIVTMSRVLNALSSYYSQFEISKRRPIKGYVQLMKMFLYIIGGVAVVAVLMDKSPWGILSGIGALTAVLMLVFKDTLLSLVAGIQINANDLLRTGDWIEMPSMGADGDVVDVALHTVKVQNFDKTIVAIPTFKFLDTSFRNWRGMTNSGGRRICRDINLDQSSIRFADEALIGRLSGIQLLKPYIETRQREIDEHNAKNGVSPDSPLNGRRMTNIGLFRAYVEAYLKAHPCVRKDMTLIVRQQAPDSSKGLPLQIYCFTNTTVWKEYECIQSDIFDHLLAALPIFNLRAYQRNAYADTRSA